MNGLSCGEEIMTIYSAVLIQYQRVTDRRTVGRTDGRTDGHGQTSSLYLLRASAELTHVKTIEQSGVRKGSPMEGVGSMAGRI